MVTRSIVGRFLILAILLVAVGIVAQAALILTEGGKKAVKTASAAPVTTETAAVRTDAPAGDPIRVVYPGPLGDAATPRPKLADSAPASPLAAPAPQTTAKLAQAMAGPAAVAPQPAPSSPVTAPAAAPQPAPTEIASAATLPATPPSLAAAPAAPPTPADAAPAPATPAGVEVASLGGGAAPEADAASAGGVNINTASVEALNHLGGGHIGQTIARHRPYQSVDELVRKRVLRRSVFDQIKGQIAAK